jgi:mRNA-degrading endonuclease toxin of MazEF toxin-antitoxin module
MSLLKLNTNNLHKLPLIKWQIYVVSYGIGTGSEIIANRPSIIFKNSEFTKGDDVLVIPLTSAVREKLADKFDIFVPKDGDNKLFQNSFARLRQTRAISIKRIGKLLGTITDEKVKNEINSAMQTML